MEQMSFHQTIYCYLLNYALLNKIQDLKEIEDIMV